MAGHSKWKNNLGRKTSQDAKRSANFGKLSRAITVATLEGGSGDLNLNPRLRVAVDKARTGSMPKDNIDRAIAKAIGPDKTVLKSALYEIFGPRGSTLLVTVTTDNANRTTSEMRSLAERNGGKMGNAGSVAHLFDHCAVCEISDTKNPHEAMSDERTLAAAEALDAQDVEEGSEKGKLICFFPFTHLGAARAALEKNGFVIHLDPQPIYRPKMPLELSEEQVKKLDLLIEALENHDDVQEVFTNVA